MEEIKGSVFWVDVEKIIPNPYQPRHVFDEIKIKTMSESIKQYGVLQPLLVVKKTSQKDDGGMETIYELLAGERRLRASKLANIKKVPVILREKEDKDQIKLEIGIIENLQREDLTPIDRARAFKSLIDEFHLTHQNISDKIGKSREYVSNSIRLLSLEESMIDALQRGVISEGHARPLLMLSDKKEEQQFLFDEIMNRRLTVRDAERISRRIAVDKVRSKNKILFSEYRIMEDDLSDKLGAQVYIESNTKNEGKILINFSSKDDLDVIYSVLSDIKETDKSNQLVESKENTFEKKNTDEDLYSNFSI